jgi:asparagine synthase (glutamine-hydrolysing)
MGSSARWPMRCDHLRLPETMCGIAGFITLDPARVDQGDLRAMSAALAHRGPDDAGIHLEPGVGLAHRRLAILDLSSAGHEPMEGPGGAMITYNGEVYNFQDIAAELAASGISTRTRCDAEVVLLALERWGFDAALPRFNGMFAFAHWDPRTRTITLVRDRLGVKPLYYYADDTCLVFASELRALQRWSGCPVELDPQAVDLYVTYEHVPAPRTILRGVRKLEPGTILQWHEGRLTTRRWWELRYDEPTAVAYPDDEWTDQVYTALREATRLRLVSDAPLGALLSGGIDSSAIVALMAELGQTPSTFSVGFSDASYNELEHARAVARHVGADHHEEMLVADAESAIDIISTILDEPMADVSLLPTYLVSRMARRHVTVALSGDGGDEVFAGYDWYRAAQLADGYRRLPGPVRWAIDSGLSRVPPRPEKKGLVNMAKRFSEGAAGDPRLEHLRWQMFAGYERKRALYRGPLRPLAGAGAAEALGLDLLARAAARDSLSRQQWADLQLYLPDDILTKVDRASMAVALETRNPFLDVNVVELATRVPAHLRMRGRARKVVLRRAIAPLLPPGILDRRKQGFSMPMKQWLRGPLAPMMRDVLASADASEWFDATECHRLIEEHIAGSRNNAHLLWTLMTLELWRKRERQAIAADGPRWQTCSATRP